MLTFTNSHTQSSDGLMEGLVAQSFRQPEFQEEVCSWGMKVTGDCLLLKPIWLLKRKLLFLKQSLRLSHKFGLLFFLGQDSPRLLGQRRWARCLAFWEKKENIYWRTSVCRIQPWHLSNVPYHRFTQQPYVVVVVLPFIGEETETQVSKANS